MRSLYFACLSLALLVSAGIACAQPVMRGPSPYTQAKSCPAGQKAIAQSDYVPPGWQALGGADVKLIRSDTSEFQGEQFLSCQYNMSGTPEEFPVIIRRKVPLKSCIVSPDHKGFVCRPGTPN